MARDPLSRASGHARALRTYRGFLCLNPITTLERNLHNALPRERGPNFSAYYITQIQPHVVHQDAMFLHPDELCRNVDKA